MQGAAGGTPVMSSSASGVAPLLSSQRVRTSHKRARVPRPQCSAQTLSRTYTGTQTAPPKRAHHFLHIDDFSKDDLSAMLSTARTVKDRVLRGDNDYKPFAGMTMAMIFTKPSMRTRVSFETVSAERCPASGDSPELAFQASFSTLSVLQGFFKLGGHAIYLGPETIQIGKREATKDIARVLCRCVLAFTFVHSIVQLSQG